MNYVPDPEIYFPSASLGSLYFHLNLPLHLLVSIYLCLFHPNISCLFHLIPVLLHPTPTVRMTELYPSCHQKGNVRKQQAGNGGGKRMRLLGNPVSVLAGHDTCKQPIVHPRFIFFIVAVICVTAHEPHYTPMPDMQLIWSGEVSPRTTWCTYRNPSSPLHTASQPQEQPGIRQDWTGSHELEEMVS